MGGNFEALRGNMNVIQTYLSVPYNDGHAPNIER